jgi:2-isopropylmalate synthase
VADASLELLLRRVGGWQQRFFELESYRVIADHGGRGQQAAGNGQSVLTEATVKVHVAGRRRIATAEGNGPVHALDGALRRAVEPFYPQLAHIHLTDFRVRVLGGGAGTAAVTRVLVDTSDAEGTWTTIGVSENIIEASWHALVDAVVYGLLRAGVEPAAEEVVLEQEVPAS